MSKRAKTPPSRRSRSHALEKPFKPASAHAEHVHPKWKVPVSVLNSVKLFHGTSESAAKQILNDGLLPRELVGSSNWENLPSNPKFVYLTNAYAPFYGISALTESEDRFAVLQINTALLNPTRLCPDEDFLEMNGKNRDRLPQSWDLERRTAHYRDLMLAAHELWIHSLNKLGTCAYHGAIPVDCIMRVAYVDKWMQAELIGMAESPSLADFTFGAARYTNMLNFIFDQPLEDIHDTLDEHTKSLRKQLPYTEMGRDLKMRGEYPTLRTRFEILGSLSREGIEIVNLQ